MPLEVRQTSAAREDLIGIWLYIDSHSPSGASRIVQRIKEVSQRLAEYPEMGRAMLEIDGSLRVFPVEGYVIIYRATSDVLTVVRVLSHYRDLAGQAFPDS